MLRRSRDCVLIVPMRTLARYNLLAKHKICTLLIATLLLSGCGQQRETELPATLHLAREAAQTEDWQTAKEYLLDAKQEFPNSLTVQMNLAMVQWRQANFTDAIATFNEIVNRDTVPAVIWKRYAQLQLDAGNPHATRELLDNIDPPTPKTLTLAAMADMKMQAYERAKLALEHALERDATYAPAWFHLAILYRDHIPNMVEAQMAFRHFESNAPENARANISDVTFFGQALPDPVPATEETQRIPGADREATSADIEKKIRQVQALTEQGETDTALILLKQTVEQYPNNPDAVWALAQFYDAELELTDRADGLYNTFMQLFPRDERVKDVPQRARTRQAQQRPTGDTAVRQALLFQQGIEHYSRQEWDAAITAFRRVLSMDPQDAGAAFNLGLAYHKTDDLDAAATAFRQALEHEPEMIKSLYMLGLTERDRNNIPESLHLLNRVIRMQPDFAKAHQILGRIYLQEGRPDMTAIHFERILEIDPHTDEARNAQAWLEQQQDTR